MKKAIAQIILHVAIFLASYASLNAATLLTEDWQTNTIDTNKWVTNTSGSGYVAVDQYSPGQYALALNGVLTFQDYVRTADTVTFSRGSNLRCTFRVWSDSSRTGVLAQPAPFYGGVNGPWLSQPDPLGQPLTYQWPEAMVVGNPASNPLRFSLREGTNSNPPVNTDTRLPDEFKTAFNAATSSAAALYVRVWLGNTSGALLEYSTDGGANYNIAMNTLGTGPDQIATGLGIGFAGDGGFTLIDDIIVDNGAALPTPTPTPTPTPSPTPTGTPTPTPSPTPASTIFFEDWQTGTIDTNKWIIHEGGAGQVGPNQDHGVFVEAIGGGDYALAMNGVLTFQDYVRSVQTFSRGNNIRCSFKVWNDTTRVGVIQQHAPNYGGINAPWINGDPVGQPVTLQTPEAMIVGNPNYNPVGFGVRENIGTAWSDPGYGNLPPSPPFIPFPTDSRDNIRDHSPFIDNAWFSSISKATALIIRVTLGNTNGAKVEYSTDGGQTFVTEVSNLDTAVAPIVATATGLSLAFAADGGVNFVDDIAVEAGGSIPPPVNSVGSKWNLYP